MRKVSIVQRLNVVHNNQLNDIIELFATASNYQLLFICYSSNIQNISH